MLDNKAKQLVGYKRSQWLFGLVVLVGLLYGARLFYLQVVRGSYYANLARGSQERKFEIDAQRGQIYALDREKTIPLVLNENRPIVFADTRYITDKKATAQKLASILGGSTKDIQKLLAKETAYIVISKKTPKTLADKVEEANLLGIGTIDQYYRAYPENRLASQVLGFVNLEGQGQYGVEKYSDSLLKGVDGRVEAITDVHGVPLRGEEQKVLVSPKPGSDITLTIDVNIQTIVEDALREYTKLFHAKSASAVVVDPNTGKIVAMANYPTYNPANYSSVNNYSIFANPTISQAYEIGSVVKVFTMSAGLNEGVVTRKTTYKDTGSVIVDGTTIRNAVPILNRVRTMDDVIQDSANVGAVYVLNKLGGGEINKKARQTLFDYFTKHFRLGDLTGIDLPGEAKGLIHPPNTTDGPNVRYANMTFGQGLTVSMIQIAAGLSSVVNGGTYYKPYIVGAITDASGTEVITKPKIVSKNVILPKTSRSLRAMMQLVVRKGSARVAKRSGYRIGAKTGTAQLPLEDGTYSSTRTIGSVAGYIEGGSGLRYVIVTRINEPQGISYAGAGAAAPLFAKISNAIIDYERIPPI